jgi:DNA-binding transcriptional ArsR family regulator
MPGRKVISSELAMLFGVLAHPDRIRILEELHDKELDVNALQSALEVSHSRVSQHLSVLRAHRLVAERRSGRHVFYRLVQPSLAKWIFGAVEFFDGRFDRDRDVSAAAELAREHWLGERHAEAGQ